MSLVNTALDPPEPLLRAAYDLVEDSMAGDEEPAQPRPCVGILAEDESWQKNKALGQGAVSKDGIGRLTLILLVDAPKRGGGVKGPRGVDTISQLIFDGLDDATFEVEPGARVSVDSRRRFTARTEDGELAAFAGEVIAVSYPLTYERTS
jgi:hypothetical protein